ncbi:hypothetical protein BVY03_00995 [bacterium K02(2017)]|nr:hypothetical protein BVY03_00995 [bacterium K02(2017)]
MIKKLTIQTNKPGLYEFTSQIQPLVKTANINEGICHVYVQHTSASLIIQENADPSVQVDLQNWLSRLVKENDSLYTHTIEGPDDMPSHIRSVLTATSLSIPILNAQLALGTWQGIYLWEHRHQPHLRNVLVYCGD